MRTFNVINCGLPSIVLVVAAFLGPSYVLGQNVVSNDDSTSAGVESALFRELVRMDSLLFDASFVSCDAELANSFFTDDVEFYHDQTGFQSSEQTRENTRRLTQSCPHERGITRSLVEGSVQVYPMEGYGAIQVGTQRFEEQGVSTSTIAKFVHLWKRQDDTWKLARVLSFDHRSE